MFLLVHELVEAAISLVVFLVGNPPFLSVGTLGEALVGKIWRIGYTAELANLLDQRDITVLSWRDHRDCVRKHQAICNLQRIAPIHKKMES